MAKLFLILCLAFLCESHTPPRPNIPPTFGFHYKAVFNTSKDTYYVGHRAVVYPNMSIINETLYRPNHQPDIFYELIRDDLNEIFDVTWHNNTPDCYVDHFGSEILDFWDFVKETKYIGKETINGEVLDIWEEVFWEEEKEYMAVGVKEDQPNVPVLVRFGMYYGDYEVNYHITNFSTTPQDSEFEIPQECKKTFS